VLVSGNASGAEMRSNQNRQASAKRERMK